MGCTAHGEGEQVAARERVEALVVRDPDGGTDVTVWVAGRQVPVEVYEVDAGRGWAGEDWAAVRAACVRRASEGAKHAVASAFDNAPGAESFVGVL